MSLLRPGIIDARGQRFALLAPFSGEQRRRRRQIQRRLDITESWTRWNVAIVVTVSLLIVPVSALMIFAIFHFRLPVGLMFVAVVPLGVLPGLSGILMERRMFARRYRDALVGAGICPSCEYALSESAIEPDGCRVCPECGGAWLETVTSVTGVRGSGCRRRLRGRRC